MPSFCTYVLHTGIYSQVELQGHRPTLPNGFGRFLHPGVPLQYPGVPAPSRLVSLVFSSHSGIGVFDFYLRCCLMVTGGAPFRQCTACAGLLFHEAQVQLGSHCQLLGCLSFIDPQYIFSTRVFWAIYLIISHSQCLLMKVLNCTVTQFFTIFLMFSVFCVLLLFAQSCEVFLGFLLKAVLPFLTHSEVISVWDWLCEQCEGRSHSMFYFLIVNIQKLQLIFVY